MDYTTVTEMPGVPITKEALEMIRARYTFAYPDCKNMEVLEIACGPGQGLWYLGNGAKRLVAGDISPAMIRQANLQWRGAVLQFDAHRLPFADHTFDVVIMFEAIYYLQDVELFIYECRRVLRPGGLLVISTVNKEWGGFIPSRYSVQYYSGSNLRKRLEGFGFTVKLLGSFPAGHSKARKILVRLASFFYLMPLTMGGKVFLKRLVYGRLVKTPQRVDPSTNGTHIFTSLSCGPYRSYKILYAIARKGDTDA